MSGNDPNDSATPPGLPDATVLLGWADRWGALAGIISRNQSAADTSLSPQMAWKGPDSTRFFTWWLTAGNDLRTLGTVAATMASSLQNFATNLSMVTGELQQGYDALKAVCDPGATFSLDNNGGFGLITMAKFYKDKGLQIPDGSRQIRVVRWDVYWYGGSATPETDSWGSKLDAPLSNGPIVIPQAAWDHLQNAKRLYRQIGQSAAEQLASIQPALSAVKSFDVLDKSETPEGDLLFDQLTQDYQAQPMILDQTGLASEFIRYEYPDWYQKPKDDTSLLDRISDDLGDAGTISTLLSLLLAPILPEGTAAELTLDILDGVTLVSKTGAFITDTIKGSDPKELLKEIGGLALTQSSAYTLADSLLAKLAPELTGAAREALQKSTGDLLYDLAAPGEPGEPRDLTLEQLDSVVGQLQSKIVLAESATP